MKIATFSAYEVCIFLLDGLINFVVTTTASGLITEKLCIFIEVMILANHFSKLQNINIKLEFNFIVIYRSFVQNSSPK